MKNDKIDGYVNIIVTLPAPNISKCGTKIYYIKEEVWEKIIGRVAIRDRVLMYNSDFVLEHVRHDSWIISKNRYGILIEFGTKEEAIEYISFLVLSHNIRVENPCSDITIKENTEIHRKLKQILNFDLPEMYVQSYADSDIESTKLIIEAKEHLVKTRILLKKVANLKYGKTND